MQSLPDVGEIMKNCQIHTGSINILLVAAQGEGLGEGTNGGG